jgi:hypothetical protein
MEVDWQSSVGTDLDGFLQRRLLSQASGDHAEFTGSLGTLQCGHGAHSRHRGFLVVFRFLRNLRKKHPKDSKDPENSKDLLDLNGA